MKGKSKFKFVLIFLLIISTLIGLYIGLSKKNTVTIMNVFHDKKQAPEDLQGWNLSLLMYDTGVENGRVAVNQDVWNATNENESRVVTVQVNLSNTALAKDYGPEELVISVDTLGKLCPANEDMTSFKSPTTISADPKSNTTKEYDWSYRYDSATQKFIFTNNNTIEFGSTFESTIQMAFEFSAPYVLNGADVTIDANLNGELNSVNTLNYKFTSNKKTGTNSLTFSKIDSFDGLGENATDYIWAKFQTYCSVQGRNVRDYLFDAYIDFTVPDGCILYDTSMNQILPDDNDIYKLYSSSNSTMSYYSMNSNTYFYIGFPKSIYDGQSLDLTTSWYGKYSDSRYVKGDPNKELETISSVTKTLNLDEFNFTYSGNLYTVKKDVNSYKASSSKIMNENYGENILFYISGTTIYTGNKYKVRYGDDVLYITNEGGGYTKLNENEYYFKNLVIPATLYNGNGQAFEQNKYNIDIYVKYRGSNTYVKYGETLKNGTSSTITFNKDEIVEGWYVDIYDLEESLKFSKSNSTTSGITTTVHVQKSSGVPETGKIYNFDYLQVFNKVENNYVLVNEPESTSYSTTVTTELAGNDIANYGVYLQRGFYSKTFDKDYLRFYMGSSIGKASYDNNFFYREWTSYSYLDYESTGTDEFDGFNCYFILPEGVELNASKDELLNLIEKRSCTLSNYSYKKDGTQYSDTEMYNFFKDHLTIDIDTNYQNTGKTWIGYKVDFGDDTLNIYETAGRNTYMPLKYTIPIKIPYESYFTHGASYRFGAYVAPTKEIEPFSYNKITDNNDIDNDGETTDYYSHSSSDTTTIVPAVSSYQEASKNVWTEKTENRYATEFAIAKNGGDYKYKLKVRTGANEITNLIIYDNLENASDDWKGTFMGIDTSFTNSQGFNPKLYVSDDRNAGTLEDDPTNWRIYDASADNSQVKSVAIDYEDSIIPAGFLTFVLVDMKAPEDPNIKTLAKNTMFTKWNARDINGNIIDNVVGVAGNTVNVGLGKTEHNIVVQKTWNDNDNEHNVRPSSVLVHLFRNNIEIDQVELNEDNHWTHTFNDLRIYDDEFEKYEYTISEDNVNLYDARVQYGELIVDSMSRTFTITNTLKEDDLYKNIIGNKIWNDNDNAKGKRPTSITINLYRDGTKIDTTTTNASSDWYYEFTNLPKWKNNTQEYNYTIEEVEDEHYSVGYSSAQLPAKGAKLKFNSQSHTESTTYDYVEIYYSLNNQIYKVGLFGGTSIANTEVTIPTNDFYIYWKTDSSNHNYYGFSIDSIIPISYEGDIIGNTASLPNYTIEEINGDTYPESEHTYQDNVNQMWHYTLNNPLYSSKIATNITNTYKVIPSTVLVHHYIKNTTTSLADDETLNGNVWDTYTTSPASTIPTYYKLVATPSNATGEFATTQTVVTYYYELKDYPYRVEYYYDNVIDNSKTETDTDTYGASINTYSHKLIDGYVFDHDDGKPLTITENEDTNVIKVYYIKRSDLNYTVHYKEQGTERELATDKVVNNKTYLEEVTENAIDINGYNKVNPTTQTITIQVSGNEITFYYTKKSDLNYTVHYKEQGTERELATDKVVNNKTYLEEVTENAIDINGYNKVNPTTQTITIQVSGNEITFYYTKKSDLNYTVHYKEQGTEKELATDKVVDNKTYLEEVTENAIDINGYNKVNPTTQTITIQVSGNEITFYYTKKSDLNYTVHYKEQGTEKELATDKVVNNKTYLEEVTENAIDINGYDKVDPTTQTITIQPENNEMTFYYTKRNDLNYTVHYKEQGTEKELATDKVVNNKTYLEEVTENAIDISGYDKVDPTTQTITIQPENNEMTFYYTKKSDLNYTVHYKEQGTEKTIAENKVVGNQIFGETIEESAIDIEGYDKVNPTTAEIEITTGTNEHTFYYTKGKFNYKVEYYYDNVIDNSKTDIIEATYKDEITTYTEKPEVGYMFDKVEGTPLVIAADEDKNVIKVYYVTDPSQTKTLKYTVNYYKDGVLQENDTQVETQVVQLLSADILNVDKTKINTVDKYEDYTFEKSEPAEIPVTIENNGIINIYYLRNKYPYTIEYYYNNVKDNDATESGQAYKDDIIDTYTNKDKEGYEFESVEGLPLVISSTEENIIKVYYLPIRKITINHIDKNTDELIKTEDKTGKDGYSITTSAEDFEGYICVEKPDTEEYTYSENDQVVNYYYAKISSGVIVKHIDLISGKPIADDIHYEGFEGKEYTTSIKDIENYKHASNKQYYRTVIEKDPSYLDGSDASTVDEYLEKQLIDGSKDFIPENYAGKMAQSVIEVRYYYVPNTKLIVKYVDILTGEEIIEPIEKDGELDEEYTTSMKELDEYIPINNKTYYKNYFNNHPDELKEETVEEYMDKNNIDSEATYKPNNSEGTMTVTINPDDTYSNETIVTYYYSKEREVVIKYYDILTGKEISEETIKAGPDGEPYDISDTKKDIEGYTIVEVPESQSGIYQEHNETRKYYYAKNTQVIVKYVDKETGKEIAESKTIDGYVGKEYTTEKVNIDDYNYLSSTDNTAGKMTEETLEVIYYYNKQKYSTYTINYLDADTRKPIKEPKEVKDQKVDTTIYAKSLIVDIENYTYDHSDKDSIIIKEGENTINLYYTKNKEPIKIITVKVPDDKPEIKEPDNKVHVSNTGKSIYIDKILGAAFIFVGSIIIVVNKVIDIRRKRKE